MTKKTKRSRTTRREIERAALKLGAARRKLAELEPGGRPDRPIDVVSASVVEVYASGLPCLACDAPGTRVDAHDAVVIDGRALRVARLVCPRCGARRDVWFRLGTALPS